ncbi:MAG: hypothetical protein VX494_00150 [Actinomycetota bacterium]|nr:hypothetical protein [Actinomycetota bacterium]
MKSLGFSWHPQTVSTVENAKRRITTDELLGLSLSLSTPVSYFLRPFAGLGVADPVELGGGVLPPTVVDSVVGEGRMEPWLTWQDHDTPIWPTQEQLDRRIELDNSRREAEQRLESEQAQSLALFEEAHRLADAAGIDAGERAARVEAAIRETRMGVQDAEAARHIVMTELRSLSEEIARANRKGRSNAE